MIKVQDGRLERFPRKLPSDPPPDELLLPVSYCLAEIGFPEPPPLPKKPEWETMPGTWKALFEPWVDDD